MSSPALSLLREIVRARAGSRDIDIGKVEKALLRLRQTYYDKANKPHTLLARQLCEHSIVASPTFLRDTSGTLHSHPSKIAHISHDYYFNLYNDPIVPHNPPPPDLSQAIQSYLEDSDLPAFSPFDLASLNSSISEEEVVAMISSS